GVTQGQFAKELGVSASYIQRVELGQVPPSAPLLRKVALLTGVNPNTLGQKTGKPTMHDGAPASEEAMAQWRNWLQSEQHEYVTLLTLKDAEISLRALSSVCMELHRTDPMFISFQEWLHATVEEMGIMSRFLAEKKAIAAAWNKHARTEGTHLFVEDNPPSTASVYAANSVFTQISSLIADRKLEAPSKTLAELRQLARLGFTPPPAAESKTKRGR
ncbi:MAG TPA: helix-turn-helix transcriptional regulator, partial [Haloferula sp.]